MFADEAWQHAATNSTVAIKEEAMSAARDLATFLTGVTAADLPAQALDHAAMLVASTIASAAMGSGLESSRIVKDMASSLGGSPRASVWFDGGAKLPVVAAAQVNAVMSDAAASDASDLDRRPRKGGRYQRRPRIPCRNGDDERDPGGTRGAARLPRRGAHSRNEARVLRGLRRG